MVSGVRQLAVDGEIGIDEALIQMCKVVTATGYDRRYLPFYEIEEDLDYLRYYAGTLFNSGLTQENANDYIREEFNIFLDMARLRIPVDARSQGCAG